MDFPRAVTLWDVAKGKEIFAFHELQDLPYAVAFSPDGKTLAVATADAGRRGALIFIDVLTGRATDKLESNVAFQTVTYNPTGRMLAATLDDGALWLLDVATHATVHTLKSRPLMPPVFSPDGRVLAAASTGPKDTITLWNVDSGSEVATLSGHFREIHRLAFTPDGKMLVSTSGDTTVRTWDVATGQELLTLLSFGQNDWLAVTPDGLFDGSPVAWNQIFWRFSPSLFDVAPLEYFFTDFYEPGLMTEIFAGKRPRATSDIAQKDRRQPQLQLSVPAASEPQLSARNATVRIDVSDAPAGARDLRLFRNGSLVKVWGGDVLKGQKSVTLGTTIPIVAGENRLTAYAFNHDNVKSSDATETVTGAESLKRKGTLHILAIGVSRYANGDYDLDYTTDDATSFASQLKLQQEKLAHYQSVEIKTLLNENATKANILAELKSLSTAVQPEDAVVVYFSGHGKADGDHFYLVTHDLGYSGPRDQLSSEGLRQILMHSISDVELEEGFRGIDAGQMFMIIDACNSGQALENKDEPRRGPMNTRGLAQLAYEKGMYIMTASQSVEEAFVSEKLKHSYLTYALVEEGLKTKAADADHNGEVVLREWFDYALARVPTLREETLQSKSLVEVTPAVKAARSRKSQTPRVFYRREPDARPLVVAQVGASK